MSRLDDIREDYDWQEAFRYAEGGNQQGDAPDIRRARPIGDPVPLDPFGLGDVETLYAAVVTNEEEWQGYAAGQLKDGRYFFLEAGCDYTGWDCQAGGSAQVASTKADLLAYGISEWEREVLGL